MEFLSPNRGIFNNTSKRCRDRQTSQRVRWQGTSPVKKKQRSFPYCWQWDWGNNFNLFSFGTSSKGEQLPLLANPRDRIKLVIQLEPAGTSSQNNFSVSVLSTSETILPMYPFFSFGLFVSLMFCSPDLIGNGGFLWLLGEQALGMAVPKFLLFHFACFHKTSSQCSKWLEILKISSPTGHISWLNLFLQLLNM